MEVKEYEDGWYVGGLTDRDIRSAGGSKIFKNLHIFFVNVCLPLQLETKPCRSPIFSVTVRFCDCDYQYPPRICGSGSGNIGVRQIIHGLRDLASKGCIAQGTYDSTKTYEEVHRKNRLAIFPSPAH